MVFCLFSVGCPVFPLDGGKHLQTLLKFRYKMRSFEGEVKVCELHSGYANFKYIHTTEKGCGEMGIREMGQSVNYLLCEFDPQHAGKKPVTGV